RLEAQLVAGVRGVGYQLAQEDLLVRVERMGHQVEDLVDFSFELAGLGGCGHGMLLLKATAGAGYACAGAVFKRRAGSGGGVRLVDAEREPERDAVRAPPVAAR